MKNNNEIHDKSKVAFASVIAAVFLTGFKLLVGIVTRSMGILSEAMHSALDLVAAVTTFFAVKAADRPADREHNWGHGKIENISALFETLLLFITCIWIIYEASKRLITGNTIIEVSVWSYLVVSVSIAIDFVRSRALYRAAKKHKSQALEADALHFSTDIWSSVVVLLGLIFANIGFHYADSIAALFVAVIVVFVSFRLGKRSIDALLDKSPDGIVNIVNSTVAEIPEVLYFHDIKIRMSGAKTYIELNIHLQPEMSLEQAHKVSEQVENKICEKISNCEVHIHQEPEEFH